MNSENKSAKELEQPPETQKNTMQTMMGTTPSIFTGLTEIQASASLREFNFPIPAGMASIKVPFPLSEDDFEVLMQTLTIFKRGLVKTPPKTELQG